MAVCVAVIAKENYPLYIRSVPTENELKFHYMVHTSLDVVDEKISAMGKALVDQRELYLGLLYPTEDYKVPDFAVNTPGLEVGSERDVPEAAQLLHRCDVQPLLQPGGPHPVQGLREHGDVHDDTGLLSEDCCPLLEEKRSVHNRVIRCVFISLCPSLSVVDELLGGRAVCTAEPTKGLSCKIRFGFCLLSAEGLNKGV
nr:trafficking protein particle complex subunit 2-like protein isoform X1 [Manis javanica]